VYVVVPEDVTHVILLPLVSCRGVDAAGYGLIAAPSGAVKEFAVFPVRFIEYPELSEAVATKLVELEGQLPLTGPPGVFTVVVPGNGCRVPQPS
jgi:hypothetical protein